jgi:hypothetical protein
VRKRRSNAEGFWYCESALVWGLEDGGQVFKHEAEGDGVADGDVVRGGEVTSVVDPSGIRF